VTDLVEKIRNLCKIVFGSRYKQVTFILSKTV